MDKIVWFMSTITVLLVILLWGEEGIGYYLVSFSVLNVCINIAIICKHAKSGVWDYYPPTDNLSTKIWKISLEVISVVVVYFILGFLLAAVISICYIVNRCIDYYLKRKVKQQQENTYE